MREKHQSGRLPYVPWPGTGPTALWCTGWRPNAAAGPEPQDVTCRKGRQPTAHRQTAEPEWARHRNRHPNARQQEAAATLGLGRGSADGDTDPVDDQQRPQRDAMCCVCGSRDTQLFSRVGT